LPKGINVNKPRVPVKHLDLLTDETKQKIRDEAKLQVEKEQRETAAKAYLEECKEAERSFTEPELQDTLVTIDVPGFTQYCMVDGRMLAQGEKRVMTKAQAQSLWEVMQDAWRHEKSNGCPHNKEYMAPRQDSMSAGGAIGGNTGSSFGHVARF
jgi:hypothetical protein